MGHAASSRSVFYGLSHSCTEREQIGGTPIANNHFFGGTNGTQRLNCLQLYYQDIDYGIQNTTPETITLANGTTASETFQDLLNMVSGNLLEIAETEP